MPINISDSCWYKHCLLSRMSKEKVGEYLYITYINFFLIDVDFCSVLPLCAKWWECQSWILGMRPRWRGWEIQLTCTEGVNSELWTSVARQMFRQNISSIIIFSWLYWRAQAHSIASQLLETKLDWQVIDVCWGFATSTALETLSESSELSLSSACLEQILTVQ